MGLVERRVEVYGGIVDGVPEQMSDVRISPPRMRVFPDARSCLFRK